MDTEVRLPRYLDTEVYVAGGKPQAATSPPAVRLRWGHGGLLPWTRGYVSVEERVCSWRRIGNIVDDE